MITVKRGLNLPLAGTPVQRVGVDIPTQKVAVVAQDFIGLKPKMLVEEGALVKLGQGLFQDKNVPSIVYTAPANGKVTAVNRGHKRKLLSVEISVNEDNPNEQVEIFSSYSEVEAAKLSRNDISNLMLKSGLWVSLRTRPFSKVPNPNTTPSSIFVTAIDTNPLAAKPEVIIKESSQWFEQGINSLAKLTKGPVHICTAYGVKLPVGVGKQTTFSGPHPAGLVGTHIHYLDPVHKDKIVWHIGYQDVIALGHLVLTGKIYNNRVISLAGPLVENPMLLRTRLGANISELIEGKLNESKQSARLISGSVFGGRIANKTEDNFLGQYHNMITVLAEGTDRPMFHYLSLGCNRFSVMPIYLSMFMKKMFPFTTTTNGSERAMVPIGSYEKVMPMDILPTQLLRALIVGDLEMAEKLGALELDEEDLALCTYVCPGKYEYGPILRDNLTKIELEG